MQTKMNCLTCGKYLGPTTAILKGKQYCKKCRQAFETKAKDEFGLKVIWVNNAKAEAEIPEGFKVA